jgi:disulfide bond formation protein DsbB
MSTATVSLFFALLSLIAWASTLVVAGLALAGPRAAAVRHAFGRSALGLAWIVATVATGGSLYYSEVVGYTPCVLCWYQRIAAYPLVVVLGIATLRRDLGIRPYVIAVSAIGAVIAAYHSWIQVYPPDSGSAFCSIDVPCTARHVWELGFVSLPLMALAAFASIIALTAAAGWAARGADPEPDPVTEPDRDPAPPEATS